MRTHIYIYIEKPKVGNWVFLNIDRVVSLSSGLSIVGGVVPDDSGE